MVDAKSRAIIRAAFIECASTLDMRADGLVTRQQISKKAARALHIEADYLRTCAIDIRKIADRQESTDAEAVGD